MPYLVESAYGSMDMNELTTKLIGVHHNWKCTKTGENHMNEFQLFGRMERHVDMFGSLAKTCNSIDLGL